MSGNNRLYVGGIGESIARDELEELFGKFGRVEQVWVASNPPGFAFVTFENEADAAVAVAELNGEDYAGRMLKVEISKPRAPRDGDGGGGGGWGREVSTKRIYVGGLNEHVSRDALEQLFSKIGKVQDVWMAHNPPGYAFVTFETDETGKAAVEALNGEELSGCVLRVEIPKPKTGGGRGGGGGSWGRGGGGGRRNW